MKTSLPLVAALCLAVAGAPSTGAADVTASEYQALADKVGPTLVTIKFIMKLDGPGAERFGDGGKEMEVSGVVVDPAGLVLVSNIFFGGGASRMGLTANPTDIKVLVGEDTEGLKARILARDTDIDLCWLRIDDEKAKDKTFASIDLNAAATPAVGDRLLSVDRMGKFFDHALVVEETRLGGVAKKPRRLLLPSGSGDRMNEGSLGMPMFTSDGKVVGINVAQLPNKEDAEGGDSMGRGNAAIVLLPADEVTKATKRAKDTDTGAAAPAAPAAAPAAPATTPAAADQKPAPDKK